MFNGLSVFQRATVLNFQIGPVRFKLHGVVLFEIFNDVQFMVVFQRATVDLLHIFGL